MSETSTISELHHGKWWGESWKQLCNTEVGSQEILVPIILYMDGIAIDKQGKHSLTPLNMTLGIFNTATRRLPEAWETLYFHPSAKYPNEGTTRNAAKLSEREANLTNLHTGLAIALQSFKEVCDSQRPIQWNHLPYAGKKWPVKMKFAIAYVIGDTVEHDKLCGRMGAYHNVKGLCRHCTCPSELYTNTHYNTPLPSGDPVHETLKYFLPSDLIKDALHDDDYFKSISHYAIDNAFHKFEFGAGNPHGIHLATPAESLHMHKLGVEKRACEHFQDFVRSGCSHKYKPAYNFLMQLSHRYGTVLTRQSDRDFPRTKSSSESVMPSKREGNEFVGTLLTFMLAMLSEGGNYVLRHVAGVAEDHIKQQVNMIQVILGMNRFLGCGYITTEELKRLPLVVAYFVQQIIDNIHRDSNLLKFHLYFHLPKYISMWGPPCGWDSSFNESHHKTEIKAPAKNTQCRGSTFVKQTISRLVEYRTVQLATDVWHLGKEISCENPPERKSRGGIFGAKFLLYREGRNGTPTMSWKASRDKDRVHHPDDIISFCCQYVIPITTSFVLEGFTEHIRVDQLNNTKHIFRAHPSYQSTSGQANGVWYDWAIFELEEEMIPCQIICVLSSLTAFEQKGNKMFEDTRLIKMVYMLWSDDSKMLLNYLREPEYRLFVLVNLKKDSICCHVILFILRYV